MQPPSRERAETCEPAVVAFADYLERRAAGEELAFESWVVGFRELEPELRALDEHWRGAAPLLDELGVGRSVLEEIDRSFGEGLDPGVRLDREGDGGEASGQLLARVRSSLQSRYRVKAPAAGGGPGELLRVRDENLRRDVAMKLVAPAAEHGGEGEPDPPSSGAVARLLEEAEITAQLDHPGVVPVHELGLDSRGRAYFTMKLVEGDTLEEAFQRVARGEPGWTRTRAITLLIRVGEALASAHAKGVVHRDLNPANVRVGPFGEVYVTSWGRAVVLERETPHSERAGCPAYAAPEQLAGQPRASAPAADVYSLGALLHRLLAGAAPPSDPGEREPVHLRAPDVPDELAAICEKAMAPAPAERYADAQAFGADLQAFLDGRVVRAHASGALAELRKWVQRNRPLAAAMAAGVVLLVAGLVVALLLRAEADRQRDGVLRLSAFRELEALQAEAHELWPAHPENDARFDAWLARAADLVAGLDPRPGDAGHRAQLAEVAARRSEWSAEDAWWHGRLAELVENIEAFADHESGLIEGTSTEYGWGVARRKAWAATIVERSLGSAEAQAAWAEACAAIGSDPVYGGLELAPQRGLLPIWRDPQSGLWEFAHLATGEPARPGPDGKLRLTEDTGLVLVLVPGGSFLMGGQRVDPEAPMYDPAVSLCSRPVHPVRLSPFFVSKYEMTQAQWLRLTDENPSLYAPGQHGVTWVHPVTSPSWDEQVQVLGRAGLTLPSEAQWEYAARAGTTTRWWTGDEPRDLLGAVNFADIKSHHEGTEWESILEVWSDGYQYHAPVDDCRPNPFGLYFVHGNVAEYCLDGHDPRFYSRSPARDPVSDPARWDLRIGRSFSYYNGGSMTSSAWRFPNLAPEAHGHETGVRPARGIEARGSRE